MHSDCSFRMGRDHTVCQDYGVARSGEPTFVILADGCSSSPDTDVGARLLVRSAERLLPEWLGSAMGGEDPSPVGVEGFHRRVVLAARDHAAGLGLDTRCLDATLLTVAVSRGHWLAMVYGDGVLAVGERGLNGCSRVRVQSISYSGGYPDYPSYLADTDRQAAFAAVVGNRRQVEAWELTSCGVLSTERDCLGDFAGGCYVATGLTETAEWIAVLTDGTRSFSVTDPRERTSSRVPLPEVLKELLAFKSRSGVFVQRRIQRFLKECDTRGWQHHDDLGMAAIGMR